MAREPLPANYLKAGEEYLAALIKLGLNPEFLGWGLHTQSQHWFLILVTSVVEVGGPLALNELLFRAYNMHATPQNISPFIVRVYGSKTFVVPELQQLYAFATGDRRIQMYKPSGEPHGEPSEAVSMGKTLSDFHIESTDVYRLNLSNKKSHEKRTNEWLRFKRNVERLAA